MYQFNIEVTKMKELTRANKQLKQIITSIATTYEQLLAWRSNHRKKTAKIS